MAMVLLGVDSEIYDKLAKHRKPNEDIDKTIERLISIVEDKE